MTVEQIDNGYVRVLYNDGATYARLTRAEAQELHAALAQVCAGDCGCYEWGHEHCRENGHS